MAYAIDHLNFAVALLVGGTLLPAGLSIIFLSRRDFEPDLRREPTPAE